MHRGACPRSGEKGMQFVNFTEAKLLNKTTIIYICSDFESEKAHLLYCSEFRYLSPKKKKKTLNV
jgi:hypothetical protein